MIHLKVSHLRDLTLELQDSNVRKSYQIVANLDPLDLILELIIIMFIYSPLHTWSIIYLPDD